ncbi:MAG: hypothetical protein ACOX60_12865 [Massiliimalia sp.]|jgi:hypothetical protein
MGDIMKLNKKQVTGLLFSILLCLTAGCSSNGENEKLEEEQYDAELTIYMDPISEELIRVTVGDFESSSPFKVKWNLVDCTDMTSKEFRQKLEQDRKKGEGPDILFLNSFTCTDPNLEMQRENLLDLTEYIEGLQQEGTLLQHLADACTYDGKNYLQPICFQLPVFLGLNSVVTEVGFQTESCSNISGLLGEASRLMEREISMFDQPGILEELVSQYGGAVLIDYDTGELQTDSPELQKLCEQYQKLYEWDHSVEERKPGYTSGYQALWNKDAIFTNSHQEYLDYFSIDMQAANYQDSSVLLAARGIDEEPSSVITNSAGIWVKTEYPDEALGFLTSISHVCNYYLYPSSMPAVEWRIRNMFLGGIPYLQGQTTYDYQLATYGIPMERYWDKAYAYQEEYLDLVEAKYPVLFETDVIKAGGIFSQSMEPFWEGSDSYENCLQKLNQKLKSHLFDETEKEEQS